MSKCVWSRSIYKTEITLTVLFGVLTHEDTSVRRSIRMHQSALEMIVSEQTPNDVLSCNLLFIIPRLILSRHMHAGHAWAYSEGYRVQLPKSIHFCCNSQKCIEIRPKPICIRLQCLSISLRLLFFHSDQLSCYLLPSLFGVCACCCVISCLVDGDFRFTY